MRLPRTRTPRASLNIPLFRALGRESQSSSTPINHFCFPFLFRALRSEESVKFTLGLSSFNSICPRWVSVGPARWGLRMNWVCSLLAIIVLWGFGIWCIADGQNGVVGANFSLAQSWVTQNFTWFYIGTQDVWCLMLIYVCFSRYGDLRLGKVRPFLPHGVRLPASLLVSHLIP